MSVSDGFLPFQDLEDLNYVEDADEDYAPESGSDSDAEDGGLVPEDGEYEEGSKKGKRGKGKKGARKTLARARQPLKVPKLKR